MDLSPVKRRFFVSGAAGFVGRAVIDELLSRGNAVFALTHRRKLSQSHPDLQIVEADLFDPGSLAPHLQSVSAVIHLVGIIREAPQEGVTFDRMHVEATRSVLRACEMAGVGRYLHMSALGSRRGAASQYHQTKWTAEELARASALDWTIFRPSMIHGPAGEFMTMETGWAKGTVPPYFFMPYFAKGILGRGTVGRIQPIDVRDIARAVVDAANLPATSHRAFDLAGPEPMTWQEMHRRAATILVGHERLTLPLPRWLAMFLAGSPIAPLLPFNRDQVIMALEDNTCDITPTVQTFGWIPRTLNEGLEEYRGAL